MEVPAVDGAPKAKTVKIDKVQIATVVAHSDASVRLRNCIRVATHAKILPATTVGEYIAGLPNIEREFLALPNYGRKCATELTELITRWSAAAALSASTVELLSALGIHRDIGCLWEEIEQHGQAHEEGAPSGLFDRTRFLRILEKTNFPDCVLDQPISVRLKNALNNATPSIFPNNLATVLSNWQEFITTLKKRPNVGRTTIAELDKCIGRYIQSLVIRAGFDVSDTISISDWLMHSTIPNSPHTICEAHWVKLEEGAQEEDVFFFDARNNWSATIRNKPDEGVSALLTAVLAPREIDVLDRRYGITHKCPQTLDAISKSFGITRERVRQIESKAFRKCRTPSIQNLFKVFLETTNPHNVLEDASKVFMANELNSYLELLSGYQRLAIDICYGRFPEWMNANFIAISNQEDASPPGWVHKSLGTDQNLSRFVNGLDGGDSGFRRAVRAALHKFGWPVSLATLQAEIPGLTALELTKRLERSFGAVVEEGMITSMPHLPASLRMILVLKDAGRPLHSSEIRARHIKLFGIDVEEHACTSALQRLDNAIIVERGVYGLYEHLKISGADVAAIRDAAYDSLVEKGHFTSAKILQRELLKRLPPRITTELNPYIILGICQDDARFSVRRGLMIGLGLDGFEETFSPLNEQVHEIIRKHGPVSIAAVRELLGQARDILSVSVYQICKDSPEIVAIGDGLFDVTERVLGGPEAVESFSNAIKIALIDGPCSLPIMLSRLRSVKQNSNPSLVLSYLRNAGFVLREGTLFKLRTDDALIAEYNDYFRGSQEFIKQRSSLEQRLEFRELYQLDYRAIESSVTALVEEEQSGVLSQLLAEFDF